MPSTKVLFPEPIDPTNNIVFSSQTYGVGFPVNVQENMDYLLYFMKVYFQIYKIA